MNRWCNVIFELSVGDVFTRLRFKGTQTLINNELRSAQCGCCALIEGGFDYAAHLHSKKQPPSMAVVILVEMAVIETASEAGLPRALRV